MQMFGNCRRWSGKGLSVSSNVAGLKFNFILYLVTGIQCEMLEDCSTVSEIVNTGAFVRK